MGEAIVMGLDRMPSRSRANVCKIIVIIGGAPRTGRSGVKCTGPVATRINEQVLGPENDNHLDAQYRWPFSHYGWCSPDLFIPVESSSVR
jgi:hypothetical protein